MRPILRTAYAVCEDVRYMLNDTGSTMWVGASMARAYNRAIDAWGDRLLCPVVYTGIAQWDDDTYEYTLPSGINPAGITPQFRKPVGWNVGLPIPTTEADPWTDFASFSVEPSASGDWVLRFGFSPPDVEARIIHYMRPGRIGYNANLLYAPVNGSGLDATATSVVLTGVFEVAEQGFVLIDQEWIYYGGVTKSSTETTLSGLVRGYGSTSAAVHAAAAACYWGAAFANQSDVVGLMDAIAAECHRQKLGVVAAADVNYHQQLVTYYDARVERLMRQRTRPGGPRMLLDPNFTFTR